MLVDSDNSPFSFKLGNHLERKYKYNEDNENIKTKLKMHKILFIVGFEAIIRQKDYIRITKIVNFPILKMTKFLLFFEDRWLWKYYTGNPKQCSNLDHLDLKGVAFWKILLFVIVLLIHILLYFPEKVYKFINYRTKSDILYFRFLSRHTYMVSEPANQNKFQDGGRKAQNMVKNV